MALLHVMVDFNLPAVAAHFDHQLREESSQEVSFARDFALSLGIPFFQGSGDVRSFSEEKGLSIEEAARILRYQFLFQTAADLDAEAVAVAHHADDQVETILMNLFRGTGMKGLLGMQERSLPNQWSESIALVRPFLGIWKTQILAYLDEHHLSPLLDPSNAENIYHRNKIRHELIPLLDTLAPGFQGRLLQTAEILSEDESSLQQLSEDAWRSCLDVQERDQIQLKREALRNYSPAIQRRLVRKALTNLRPEFRDLSYQQVERARAFIKDPDQKATNWVAKVNLTQSSNKIIFSAWELDIIEDQFPQLINKKAIRFPEEGEVALGNGWFFVVQPIRLTLNQFTNIPSPEDEFTVLVDGGKIGDNPELRVRKEGDVFSPLGMGGKSMKVSDLMINEKIPAAYRSLWPIVANQESILWVPGGRLGHIPRITESTKFLLRLSFINRGD